MTSRIPNALTKYLARIVFHKIKNHRYRRSELKTGKAVINVIDYHTELALNINLKTKQLPSSESINSDGAYLLTEKRIGIDIYSRELPILPEHYEDLYHEVREIVRHEIEHHIQCIYQPLQYAFDYTRRSDQYISNQEWEAALEVYAMAPAEIEANANTFYLIAKKTRTPINQILKREKEESIDYAVRMTRGGLPKERAVDIYNEWEIVIKQYLRSRYPRTAKHCQ